MSEETRQAHHDIARRALAILDTHMLSWLSLYPVHKPTKWERTKRYFANLWDALLGRYD